MTLDEVIKQARKVAKESRENIIDSCNLEPFETHCNSEYIKFAEEHEQLANWLEELKTFKEKFAEILLYDHEIAERKIYEKAYNDAIDDFTKKIAGYGTYDDYGNVIDILEIAEELKKNYR